MISDRHLNEKPEKTHQVPLKLLDPFSEGKCQEKHWTDDPEKARKEELETTDISSTETTWSVLRGIYKNPHTQMLLSLNSYQFYWNYLIDSQREI